MRYLTMIKTDESMPAGPPPPALFAAIGELGEQATKDGTILETGGLLPSAAGALVRLKNGQVTVHDGPFAEAKELIGGYAIFEVRSKGGRRRLSNSADTPRRGWQARSP